MDVDNVWGMFLRHTLWNVVYLHVLRILREYSTLVLRHVQTVGTKKVMTRVHLGGYGSFFSYQGKMWCWLRGR